jgi:YgiT-type zinc finger domain-containing protein
MKPYNYGKCEICNTPIKEILVNQDFWIKGELVVIVDVPIGACPQCGEKIVQADVGHIILEILNDHKAIACAPRVEVPNVPFKKNNFLSCTSSFAKVGE